MGFEVVWSSTRAGARAGRGFHFQDVVGAWLCGQLMTGGVEADRLVPEGPEDLSCEGQSAWQVQVKSRQERVGPFSPSEVAGHVLDLAARHARRKAAAVPGRPVLVLERSVGTWTPDKWGETLQDVPGHDELLQALKAAGARRGLQDAEVIAIAQLVSVFVLPWHFAAEQSRAAIATRTKLPPAASDPVVLALRNAVADCADTNAEHEWKHRASLDRTQIERIVTEVSQLVDRESLEEALIIGLCEPVDFDTPLETGSFYDGVDVQPGHIVAGLPAPRPQVTGQVVANLDAGGSVLVTGPSGVGKSAVMWAAAYSARHVLWFRVRQLRETDVPALLRLAKSMRPTVRAPVGFVVDAVGVGGSEAWDTLQQELTAIPGTVLLGSARTEDLLPLRTLANCTMIHVRLDEDTAAQIHAGLARTGALTVPHWREAFNACGGLTLEFTHLLTRGRRLTDVLTEQVNRRVAEGREMELQILALVTTAHRWSAVLELEAARSHLNVSASQFRAALARLTDEHLIHVRGTQLTGLHQLRSDALSIAVHKAPPPTLQDTVLAVLGVIDEKQLQPFIVGVLTKHPELDDAVMDRLLTDVRRKPDPTLLVATLQALRLVDFERRAAGWARVLEQHQVKPAYRSITFQLALTGSTSWTGLRPDIAAAVEQIDAQADDSPLRDLLLARLEPDHLTAILTSCERLEQATSLLAAIVGADTDLHSRLADDLPPDAPLARLLTDSPALELGELLSVARRYSDPLARVLFELAGGEPSVFRKLREHSPWLVEVRVVHRDSLPVAFARLLHISDAAEPDVDAQTRDFARPLLRCLPMCASVDVQALLPGDVPLTIGDHVFGVSQLQRRYDHPPALIVWNRVRSQVAAIAWGAVDATTRSATAHRLVVDTHRYLAELTRAWCLSRGRPEEAVRLEAQRTSLRDWTDALTLPLDRADLFTVSDSGTPSALGNDHLHTLAHGIVDNLTERMHDKNPHWPSLSAFTGDTLHSSVARVREEENWHLIDHEAPKELEMIDAILDDLHAVLAELAWGGLSPGAVVSAAKAGSYTIALSRVAALARARAETRFAQGVRQLQSTADAAGLSVQVWTRPLPQAEAVDWPQMQSAVGVHLGLVTHWDPTATEIANLVERALPSEGRRAPVLVVPLVNGRPVRLLARSLHTTLWPGHEICDSWLSVIGPALWTPLTDAVLDAHQALQALSGLAVLSSRRDGTDVLQKYADDESERLQRALKSIEEFSIGGDPVVKEIVGVLVELGQRVQDEIDSGTEEAVTLAATIASGAIYGDSSDMVDLNALLLISLQWDIDPPTAQALMTGDGQ